MSRTVRIVLGLVVAIVFGALVLIGAWRGTRALANLGYEPRVLKATGTGPHTASLELSVFPDSYPCHGPDGGPGGGAHPEWVTYCPSTTLEVPADTLVTVTIRQYDTSTAVHDPFFGKVHGTVGGVAVLNGSQIREVTEKEGGVAHTFTIQPASGARAPFFVSVPLAGVPDDAPDAVTIAGHDYPTPTVTTFQFLTGPPGDYVWHCYDPCGTGLSGFSSNFGGAMSTVGYMAGTLKVTAS